ncbi:MAG TPA: DDE-type integrase/transposase/recombinase [Chthoniobacterales bacterium]
MAHKTILRRVQRYVPGFEKRWNRCALPVGGSWRVTCASLNGGVEQDHRRIKSRVRPMLGFERFDHTRRVVIGVELVQRIIKG